MATFDVGISADLLIERVKTYYFAQEASFVAARFEWLEGGSGRVVCVSFGGGGFTQLVAIGVPGRRRMGPFRAPRQKLMISSGMGLDCAVSCEIE
jgi:hypothetical protein